MLRGVLRHVVAVMEAILWSALAFLFASHSVVLVQLCTGTRCKLDRGDELQSKQGKGFLNELAPEKDEYKIAMKQRKLSCGAV